jgi:hypothetical protein
MQACCSGLDLRVTGCRVDAIKTVRTCPSTRIAQLLARSQPVTPDRGHANSPVAPYAESCGVARMPYKATTLGGFETCTTDFSLKPEQQTATQHMGVGLQLRAFCTQNKEISTVARQLYRELLRLTQQLPKYVQPRGGWHHSISISRLYSLNGP